MLKVIDQIRVAESMRPTVLLVGLISREQDGLNHFESSRQARNCRLAGFLLSAGEAEQACYLAAAFLWCTGFMPRGLRTSGLTIVSSTGVVPLTSAVKVAPAGTR
jgi:hypothetical protein